MIVGWLISALAADPPKDVEPSGPPAVWARVDRGSVVVLRPLGGA